MSRFIDVWVEHRIPTLDALTYQCDFYVEKGMRVIVPLQSKKVVGLVCDVDVKPINMDKIKKVASVIDSTPIFSSMQFKLLEHMQKISVSNSITIVKAMLPSLLKPSSQKQSISKEHFVIVNNDSNVTTSRQHEIVAFVKNHEPMLYSDYRKYAKSLAKKLVDSDVFKIIEKDKQYNIIKPTDKEGFQQLTNDQQKVVNQINLDNFHTYLLFGITGSGKTEVYMHLVKSCLDINKNVMVLVPEVALTPQMIDRFTRRFEANIIVYHSSLSDNERYHQYKQVENNQANIIIGTRSAIFLPLQNIGIIIMDEEHDTSFKQETAPYYHVKDIAMYLCEQHNCPLLLASATPSLESYARAIKGVYTHVTLLNRINDSLAIISVVDMKQEIKKQGNIYLSETLKTKMQERLDKKEQVILLLNRRGYLPTVQCANCLEMAKCHFCDVLLTYHYEDKKLHCHHCNHVYDHYRCPSCEHTRFMGSGLATQRLQEILQQTFLNASISRLDYDSTKNKGGHEKVLNEFIDHKHDIMIGTQMVAKGLDIPNVTLVGILQADAGLSRNDFHANETTYSMISQAAGRSGRHDKQGEVVIQAFDTSHYVIQAAYKQDYKLFFNHEMNYRKQAMLPPYMYLISIIITNRNKDKSYALAIDLNQTLYHNNMVCLGPTDLGKSRDSFRYQLVIKTKDLSTSIDQLKEILTSFNQFLASISVNVSPLHLE